jgi:hypothetical protein
MSTTITLTPQELAHVLAGLRCIASDIDAVGTDYVKDTYPQLEDQSVLTPEAIDELCERINTESRPLVSIHVSGGVVTDVRSTTPLNVSVLDEDNDFDGPDDFDAAQSEHDALPLEVY